MSEIYEKMAPMADKKLTQNGVLTTLNGDIISDLGQAGIDLFEKMSPIADKKLKADGTTVPLFEGSSGGGSAKDITYDPTLSGSNKSNAQDALDDLYNTKQQGNVGISEYTPVNVSINYTTKVLTLSSVGTSFNFKVYNSTSNKIIKYTKTSPVDFPAYTNTSGIWYFHFDENGNPITTQTPWTNFKNIATVYRLYHNAITNESIFENIECHSDNQSYADHQYNHFVNGAQHFNGLDISHNSVGTGSPNSDGRNTVIALSTGSCNDENLYYTVNNTSDAGNFNQVLGQTVSANLNATNSALIDIINYNLSGIAQRNTSSRFPFLFSAGNVPQTTINGVRTDVPSTNFFVYFIWCTQDQRNGKTIISSSYPTTFSNINNANAISWIDFKAVYPGLGDSEFRPLYKLVYEYRNSYNVNCKYSVIRNVTDLRKAEVRTVSTSTGTIIASNVSFTPKTELTDNNVQSALQTLDTRTGTVNSLDGLFRKIRNGTANKIVCFGDSITYGYKIGGGQVGYTYPQKLEKTIRTLFNETTTTVVNAGIGGNTSSDGRARIVNDVLSQQPDVCVMMFGTNDAQQASNNVPIDTYRTNMNYMIDLMNNSGIAVVLMAPPPLALDNSSGMNGMLKIGLYRKAIKELARAKRVPIIDLNEKFLEVSANQWSDLKYIFPDGIHPAEAYYPLVSDFLFQEIFYKLPTTTSKWTQFVKSTSSVSESGNAYPEFNFTQSGWSDPGYGVSNYTINNIQTGNLNVLFFHEHKNNKIFLRYPMATGGLTSYDYKIFHTDQVGITLNSNFNAPGTTFGESDISTSVRYGINILQFPAPASTALAFVYGMRCEYVNIGFKPSNAAGYCNLPNGMIMQWGTVIAGNIASKAGVVVNAVFPIPFPNACVSVQPQLATISTYWSLLATSVPMASVTKNGFPLSVWNNDVNTASGNIPFYWFAIGY